MTHINDNLPVTQILVKLLLFTAGVIFIISHMGCTTVIDSTTTVFPFNEQRWFLDPSFVHPAIAVADGESTNVCWIAFDDRTSIGSPFAHWIIYQPHKIIIMIEMSLATQSPLPGRRYSQIAMIRLFDRSGRDIVISDGETEKRVYFDNTHTDKNLPSILYKEDTVLEGYPFGHAIQDVFEKGDDATFNPFIERDKAK